MANRRWHSDTLNNITLDLVLTNEEGMINKIIPLPPIGNSDHICLNVFTSMYTEEPKTPKPRLNLFKGNYGKISEDMQNIDWDTTLRGQPFTDAYRLFCNILKEKTEKHIPTTTKQKKKQEPLYHLKGKEPAQKKEGTAGTYMQNLTTQWTMQDLHNYEINSEVKPDDWEQVLNIN